MDKKTIIICILCAVIGFIIGLSLNRVETKTERVVKWKRDTIEVEIPVPIPEPYEVVRTEYVELEASLIFNKDDSLSVVPIPMERKTYKTDDYRAVIEGYKPRLVEMDIYRNTKTETITNTIYIKPKLQLGIGAGVSYIPNVPQGQNKFQPSLNVSVYVPLKTIF